MSRTTEPPLIPRKTLFGNPTKDNPRISPDGKRLAYLAPADGVLNVWIRTIGQDDDRPVTSDRERGIRSYFWSYDNQRILYVQDIGGDENWRLYTTLLTDGSTNVLTPFDDMQVHVIDYVKRFPDHMIIGMNKDNPRVHDAYRLSLATGALEMVAKNPGNVVAWLCDAELSVRGAQGALEGGFEFLVRDAPGSEWRSLVRWTPEDGLNSSPIGFTKDGLAVYLIDSRGFNTGRLVRLDIASGHIEILAEDPTYDVGGVRINEDTYEIELVAFNRARRDWLVLDPTLHDDIKAIREVHTGDFTIYNNTARNDVWLVGFTQDAGPIAYYAFDRVSKEAHLLFYNRPELATAVLAPMQPISFTARDDLTIHGYLTRPPTAPPRRPCPMVLNVHGGPWHRDTWGYNAEAQWLANRGYVCLQVNYRGSTGYGKAFLNAGDREWGGRMHDDLVDAVQWAISSGIADPERIAIYGGSYGGYAALVGATFTPDLFRCAVDIVGVSNLITFIKSIPPYWSAFLDDLHRRVGNPDTDESFLRERSPLFRADQIRIPILIAQGANDPRVKQAESEQIVEAMKRNGIDYEYLLFPDEGHGFAKPENNLRFYAVAEKFLAKHLGGRVEP